MSRPEAKKQTLLEIDGVGLQLAGDLFPQEAAAA